MSRDLYGFIIDLILQVGIHQGCIGRVYWDEMSHYLTMRKHLDWKRRIMDKTCK